MKKAQKIIIGVFVAVQVFAYFTVLQFLGEMIAHSSNAIEYFLWLVAFSITFMMALLHVGVLLLFSNTGNLPWLKNQREKKG